MLRLPIFAMMAASASAFTAPVQPNRMSLSKVTMQHGGKGFGGGEATRDPEPTAYDPNDPKGKQQAIHKAESFSEYLAKRGAGEVVLDAISDVDATRDPDPASSMPASSADSSGSEVATVTGWQSDALSKVVSTLGIVEKEYAADLGFDSFNMAGGTGTIKCYEGPGDPNVAWCSGLNFKGDNVARSSVTVFCGPLTDVPHLIASAGVSNGGIDVYIDWRPRAEGAYDPSCATLADYPEPDTREAFAQGGNRKDFAAAFFTEEVEAWRAALLSIEGATLSPAMTKEEVATISAGPMLVDIRLPLSDASAQAAAAACSSAVDRWLSWMTSAEEMKRSLPAGMRQTATYTRDTKVRANHFGFLLKEYAAKFGEEGKELAAADAGPLDEAYVGGGS